MADVNDLTAQAVRQIREQLGLSQQQLATILGISVATVSRWETGEAKPTGTAEVVMRAILEARQKMGKLPRILPLLGGLAGAVAGGFVLYKLLDIIMKYQEGPPPKRRALKRPR